MDWEDLLDNLWDLLAESGSAELEKRIRGLLKERATDDWLRSFGQTLRDGQLDQAKSLVSDFLRNHPDLSGITKKLELIVLFERRKSARSPARKARNREQLLQSVNSLVSSGKLVAAEELLEEALREDEDPELLDLSGRVYMLQRRPQQAAAVMQRALLARRHQAAFLEQPSQVEHATEVDDEVVTDADLDYLDSDANTLAGLDASSGWQGEIVEPDKSQPDEPHSAVPGHGIETSYDITGSLTASAPAADEQHVPSAEGRKTLSLGRTRRSVDVALTPQGTKILVRHAPHSKVAPSLSAPMPVTEEASPPVAPPHDKRPVESTVAAPREHRSADSGSFYCESDIQELVGGPEPANRDGYPLLLEDAQFHQQDDYEPEDDYFDNEEILVEHVELDFDAADEPVIDAVDIEDEYAAYAFDPDDVYDPLVSLESDAELPEGRVSREERALQKAVELISASGWSLTVLPLVQQIFVMNGWGATRLALEREIQKGMTPEELVLAAHVKVIWAENDYYWIAYDRGGSSSLSQHVLSWPSALLLVRSFESLPQLEELEQFIESLYEFWYERPHLRRVFRAFNRFLWFRMSNLQGCLPANQPFSFGSPHEMPVEEYSDLGVNDPLEIERTAQLRAFGVFQTKHPQEPGCYVTDKPWLMEDHVVNSVEVKSKSSEADDQAPESDTAEVAASAISADQTSLDSHSLEELLALYALSSEKDATFDV